MYLRLNTKPYITDIERVLGIATPKLETLLSCDMTMMGPNLAFGRDDQHPLATQYKAL